MANHVHVYEQPDPAMIRDGCTCHGLCQDRQRHAICHACEAWDQGYVLVDGIRRYLRSLWILANRPDKGDEDV